MSVNRIRSISVPLYHENAHLIPFLEEETKRQQRPLASLFRYWAQQAYENRQRELESLENRSNSAKNY